MGKKRRVLFISSTGGHLDELLQLSPMFKKYSYFLITEKTKSNMNLRKRYKIGYLVYGSKDNEKILYPFRILYNSFKSLCYYLIFHPDYIITTGTHTAGPMCCIGKLFGSKIIYIETFASINTQTVTGKLIYKIADHFIVQWPSMKKFYPKAINGGWIY